LKFLSPESIGLRTNKNNLQARADRVIELEINDGSYMALSGHSNCSRACPLLDQSGQI
jgi:hypothetical protein